MQLYHHFLNTHDLRRGLHFEISSVLSFSALRRIVIYCILFLPLLSRLERKKTLAQECRFEILCFRKEGSAVVHNSSALSLVWPCSRVFEKFVKLRTNWWRCEVVERAEWCWLWRIVLMRFFRSNILSDCLHCQQSFEAFLCDRMTIKKKKGGRKK